MSDLTPCNRCTLRRMQATAAARGVELIVEVAAEGTPFAGWTSVRYSDRNAPSAWLMKLTEECVC